MLIFYNKSKLFYKYDIVIKCKFWFFFYDVLWNISVKLNLISVEFG